MVKKIKRNLSEMCEAVLQANIVEPEIEPYHTFTHKDHDGG